jgi:hypothetical protein
MPWPGNRYVIIEKRSRRALVKVGDGLELQPVKEDGSNCSIRECIEDRGYFFFYEPNYEKYLGRTWDWKMRCSAGRSWAWEGIVTRAHPDGGFQMFVAEGDHTLRPIVIEADGIHVTTRSHGQTLWEFIKV